jgi:UDPglucose--hexose-1-phosphate uridylyltransferase
MFDIKDNTHRRYNPLTGEWILVSPHRGKRPWQGQEEKNEEQILPEFDSTCYLCPGNERAGGIKNPTYTAPFVFTNDFSAIQPNISIGEITDDLFQAKSERGVCRVICFSPKHNKTVPELPISEIELIIQLWQKEYSELGKLEFINHIQIFENKGSIMGCSNPHPHCQIWAQESIPEIVKKEDENQLSYFQKHSKNLLQNYIEQELLKKERVVAENSHFVAIVPFWAVWPFEIIIVPKNAKPNISELSTDEIREFAEMYKIVTCKYDNLFKISFPYSAGIHQAPTNQNESKHWCWHMHFYPPLLRSASVKKFMVGYEMLAEPQRDITAEQSAEILRNLDSTHYKL